MHCKHCGKQIEEDSMYCSFCGGKIDKIEKSITKLQPEINVQVKTVSLPISVKSTSEKFLNSFLIIALVDFGFRLFWEAFYFIVINTSDLKIYEILEPITKPLNIINSCIVLFLCFLFEKKKHQKMLILILTILVIVWYIYNIYFKTV